MAPDKKLAALCATAQAYFDRGTYVQYDQRTLNRSGSVRDERRQKGMPPEYATRQNTLHLDCSSFVYTVYYQTFGIELKADLTESLIALEDIRPFYYTVTHEETHEEREQVKKAFLDELKPGDAIIYRNTAETNGHIMFYAGDGKIIHCTGRTGGDYVYAEKHDTLEPAGGMKINRLDEYLGENADGSLYNTSLFAERISRFAILRPYGENDEVLPTAMARLNGIKDIVVEKYCSVPAGHTVTAGDEIEYYIEITNKSMEPREIAITDATPEGTELVCGKLEHNILLSGYEKRAVSYTVKVVDADRKLIIADQCVVNGFTLCPHNVMVGNHLTCEQKQAVAEAAESVCDCGCKWKFVKAVYKQALGFEIPFDRTCEAMAEMVCESKIDTQVVIPDRTVGIRRWLVPSLYGGKNMETNFEFAPPVRVREPRTYHFDIGDILVLKGDEEHSTQVWLCIGEGRLASSTGIVEGSDAFAVIDSMLGQHSFFVLRPALAM